MSTSSSTQESRPGGQGALDHIRIVLVSPLYGGNLGSVCRAMNNMGLSDLAVVAPREGMNLEDARRMACHSQHILDQRRVFATAAEAVADCGLVAATSAREGFYRDHARTPRDWAPRLLQVAMDAPVAILFGREDSGLSNEEVALATQIIRIPSSEACPSINLAQAVMLCAYELYTAAGVFEPPEERHPEAPSELRERMFAKYRETLLKIGFMQPDTADHMMMGLRRIFSRGPLTVADCRILMGIAHQASWACDYGWRLRGGDDA